MNSKIALDTGMKLILQILNHELLILNLFGAVIILEKKIEVDMITRHK
ncbi:hypothetical protein BN863_12690 [Formosa agariphila KMM 3901]|uniref:Uncharacterized protein n=1 Tax=Formosa agariphila (strain DSM 15362 / KCTC 12365 / LMG 23005 / KMM 3901 / M-2Alg 35-1) TaxID=1347342 RepID=T2KKN0_FORAG|nr:hypothetical protein BN863_12690 [Formosa agariphila KMM 3901]